MMAVSRFTNDKTHNKPNRPCPFGPVAHPYGGRST
jgi:hypothetical protein